MENVYRFRTVSGLAPEFRSSVGFQTANQNCVPLGAHSIVARRYTSSSQAQQMPQNLARSAPTCVYVQARGNCPHKQMTCRHPSATLVHQLPSYQFLATACNSVLSIAEGSAGVPT